MTQSPEHEHAARPGEELPTDDPLHGIVASAAQTVSQELQLPSLWNGRVFLELDPHTVVGITPDNAITLHPDRFVAPWRDVLGDPERDRTEEEWATARGGLDRLSHVMIHLVDRGDSTS